MGQHALRMELEGAEEIAEKFNDISKNKMKQILRQAVTVASTPILQAARRLVPRDSGQLSKSLRKKVQTYPNSGASVAIVGIAKSGFKATVTSRKSGRVVLRNPIKYGHLVEEGHRIARGGSLARKGQPATVANKGQHLGQVPPHPFMISAFVSTQMAAAYKLKERIEEGLNKEAARKAGP
jgi:HK97 gp10 family phage protein